MCSTVRYRVWVSMNIPGFLWRKAIWKVYKKKVGLVFILSLFVFLCGARLNDTEQKQQY